MEHAILKAGCAIGHVAEVTNGHGHRLGKLGNDVHGGHNGHRLGKALKPSQMAAGAGILLLRRRKKKLSLLIFGALSLLLGLFGLLQAAQIGRGRAEKAGHADEGAADGAEEDGDHEGKRTVQRIFPGAAPAFYPADPDGRTIFSKGW